MDHILFHCEVISDQREFLKQQMVTWQTSKEVFITKHKKEFYEFIEAIGFENLNV